MRAAVFLSLAICLACGNRGAESTIRVAFVGSVLTHAPFALTESLGHFREEGVSVTLERLPSAAKTIEAVLSGSAQMAGSTFEHSLHMAASGVTLQSVVIISRRDARLIVASPARRDIRSIPDLRGRNVGVPGLGSPNYLFAIHVLNQHGIRASDVSFAGTGAGLTGTLALERGKVDASVLAISDYVQLKVRNPGIVILADATTAAGSKAIWNAETIPFTNLVAKPEWIASHRETTRHVARAAARTLAWLKSHSPEEVRAALPEEYRTADINADIEGIRAMQAIYSPDGVMPPGGPEAVLAALCTTNDKIRTANINVSKLYTSEYVTERP